MVVRGLAVVFDSEERSISGLERRVLGGAIDDLLTIM